ncbi:M23 family metallopeptidase [Cohnella fermenti]|uniref:M23 family metallopeptidase n=1 Tax=Cohnella fermenti TaxID=2565925 RepID=A0A4S4BGH6_9BACL|nr:M23 family metallopeptidase [Cohnella fermenti]THF73530.1 M23 family metallopeptidase [Cohnella fermenti]
MAVFKGMDRIRGAVSAMRQGIRRSRSTGTHSAKHLVTKTKPTAKHMFAHHKVPILATGIGIIAVAGAFIGANQYVQANTTSYYHVLLNGQSIGEISDTQLVENVISSKKKELSEAETDVRYELDDSQVTYEAVSAYNKQPDDETTLAALAASLTTHPVGVKLVVNGREVGIVKNQEEADALLQKVKDKFMPAGATLASKEAVKTLSYSATAETEDIADNPADEASDAEAGTSERIVESITFEEEVTTVPVEIGLDEIDDVDELYQELTTGNPEKKTYTVQKGDCLGCIAEKLGLTVAFLKANNPWIVNDRIDIGDVLDITQNHPVLNVQSEETVTEIEVIDPPVEIRKSDDYKVGQSKTIQQGTEGRREVTYRLVKRNGTMVEEEQVSSKVLKAAVSTIIVKGTKVIPSEGTGTFAWPVTGARITSYMGKRWGTLHKGIDMVGGKTIMAADNGTVEFAGVKNGYGNAVIINHNNGFKTLYGHMKSISVKKGQVVSKGDALGIMGNTGHSTGTHLHFEVYLNGVLKNPTSYL